MLTAYTEVLARAEDGRTNLLLHCVAYSVDGNLVGRLRLEPSGEVYSLWVTSDHRRQGVATQMWLNAEALTGVAPRHSSWRTDDGDAFAQSFGVALPERQYA